MNFLIDVLGGARNAWAMSATGSGDGDQPSILVSLFPFLIVFVIIYFLMIRPQQKKQQEQQAMLSGLKVGDQVTAAGMYGEITRVKDDVIQVQVADNVRLRFVRSAVSKLPGGDGADTSEDKSSDKDKSLDKDKSSDKEKS